MLLHDAHRDARTGPAGDLVLLEEQDRALWRKDQIAEGKWVLDRAIRLRRVGPYQLQAAIAARHCQARIAVETDWPQIAALYDRLFALTPTPVVALNRAIAFAMTGTPEDGFALIADIDAAGSLREYAPLHAARADLLRRAGRSTEAAAAYRRAILLTTNDAERRYLETRLAGISRGRHSGALPGGGVRSRGY